jgi:hypothetical protein
LEGTKAVSITYTSLVRSKLQVTVVAEYCKQLSDLVLCKSLIFVGMARMMVAYFAESAYNIGKFQSSGVLHRLYLEVVANGSKD